MSAETILALTPIAIKKTPLDPTSAIWSRILSSAALGYALTEDRELKRDEVLSAVALGHTNLLHIASSYESFRNLPAGQAMSLLYTYPLWNLVFGSIFGGEKIAAHEFGLIGSAAVGSLLLNTDPGVAATTPLGKKPNATWGLFMGLIMAMSESGMHTILKGLNWLDPAKSVWVVNSSAALWLGGALGVQSVLDMGIRPQGESQDKSSPKNNPKNNPKISSWWDAILLTAFHAITMFSGYWLRFYAVPRLSTVTYSMLSYAGLIAAYVFGLLFLGERPGWISLMGAAVILGSGALLQMDSFSLSSSSGVIAEAEAEADSLK